jgi:hypothetical protein
MKWIINILYTEMERDWKIFHQSKICCTNTSVYIQEMLMFYHMQTVEDPTNNNDTALWWLKSYI